MYLLILGISISRCPDDTDKIIANTAIIQTRIVILPCAAYHVLNIEPSPMPVYSEVDPIVVKKARIVEIQCG